MLDEKYSKCSWSLIIDQKKGNRVRGIGGGGGVKIKKTEPIYKNDCKKYTLMPLKVQCVYVEYYEIFDFWISYQSSHLWATDSEAIILVILLASI